MTDEILELMSERRKFKRNEPEHKKRHKEIQKRCRKEKEKWLNDKCEEVDYLRKKHQDRDMHKKLVSLLNKIYASGFIPEDFRRSIYVTIPKKPNATECKDYRTISLMPHVMKLLLNKELEKN